MGPFADGDPLPQRLDGLVAGNGLVVGWGRVPAVGQNQFNDMGAVFVSRDGEHWRSIPLDDGVGAEDTSEPYGVSIGPLGLLAHGGVCCTVEGQAVWHSADGLTWRRLELQGDLAGRDDMLARVVGLPTGWVAAGSSSGQPAMWTSADGRTWRDVDLGQAGIGPGWMSDVAMAEDGFVAVGTIDDAARTHDGGVWASADGIGWARIAAGDRALTGPDETELFRIVPFASGFFVVGNHGLHQDRVRCENLLGAVASLDGTPPPPETALSCGWGQEHHWLSGDAGGWLRLPPLGPLPGQPEPGEIRPLEFRFVTAGGPGLVNVAEDTRPPDADNGVWVSADGSSWRPIERLGPVGPAAGLSGVAIVGRTIVAVVGSEVWLGRIH